MNRVLLTGRLTRDPELRTLASGKTVTQFSIATNEYRGGAEKSEFHNVVTWEASVPVSSRPQQPTGARSPLGCVALSPLDRC